ncbi:ACP S-malonyltransferase [Burkholderia sp. 3C]
MFAGQGAQRVGMGRELFRAFPREVALADAVLGYSIEALCGDGPAERLAQTQFTQPALYVVSALAYLQRSAAEGRPDYLLGHSVAEYVALFAAGVLDFETGLRLVKRRGELMAQASGGGMAAVLGLDAEQVDALLAQHGLRTVHAANFNTPRQIVISGERDAIERAEPLFMAGGASYYKVLQVSGAFHTPFMAEAQRAFGEFAAGVVFGAPAVPVISNVSARPHANDPQRIREAMVRQITAPVRWSDSVRYLLAKGLEVGDFEEVGSHEVAVVKPMVMRIRNEAGPLDAASLAREEEAAAQAARQAEAAQEAARAVEMPVGVAASASEPAFAPAPAPVSNVAGFTAASLGSRDFCADFGVRHAYLSGGMYQGIASVDMVVAMGQAGLLGFFGVGGMPMPKVEAAIVEIQSRLGAGAPYGINFIAHSNFPHLEEQLTDLLLRHGVRVIEASAFMEVTPALVRYRAKGLRADGGRIHAANRIIAKVSRPDVAEQFASPAPERMLAKLLDSGAITAEEAQWLRQVPMVDALCVESDSGGHTDQGMPFTLLPAVLGVRDACQARLPRFGPIYVGAAGGIGTPAAAAAVFVMGADFILTGSINQCTVEAGTSELVKDMLQEMRTYDTEYAPSGEMFELGSKVQVLKKGIFFPARASKLVALHRQYGALDEIDDKTRQQIQERYFKRSFETVFDEVRAAYPPAEIERAERNPKYRMALIFKRYFKDATRWALAGDAAHKVDFQIHCGPALGAFNQWVGGTALDAWRERRVDVLAERLMDETATLLNRRFAAMRSSGA